MKSYCIDNEIDGNSSIFSQELDKIIYDEFVKRVEKKESLKLICREHVNRCEFCQEIIKNNKEYDLETIYPIIEKVYMNHCDLWKYD